MDSDHHMKFTTKDDVCLLINQVRISVVIFFFFVQDITETHLQKLSSHLDMFTYNGRPLQKWSSNHFVGN